MSERPDDPITLSDDDLLANAIPIDAQQAESELDELTPEPEDADLETLEPIELEQQDPAEASTSGKRIVAFGTREPHEDKWQRVPNKTGQGAIHVKTFVSKLRLDAIEHADAQINHWLDNHPEYEVKFVTTTVGTLRGKLLEEALFINVWV